MSVVIDDPHDVGDSSNVDQLDKFSREWIRDEKKDSLDLLWLRDEDATHAADLPEPDEIAARITERLRTALAEMEALKRDLG